MGCSASKGSGSSEVTDPKDVKVASKNVSSGNVSMTGYHTDVDKSKKHVFTEQLVRAAPRA